MRINVTARHFNLKTELKEFAEQEVRRLKKYYDNIIDTEITLDWQKKNRQAEINIRVYGTVLTAHDQADEMHKAIIGAVDKLERQLVKYKEKQRDFDHEKLTDREPTVAVVSEEEKEI